MNLEKLALTVFKATLEQDTPDSAAYRAIVVMPGHPTLFKTFGDIVSPDLAPPYVSIEHYAGGPDNDAKTEAARSLWKITGYTRENEPLARALRDAIYQALHKKWPVTTGVDGFAGYNPILLKYPYSDTIIKQNVTYNRAGGIYELCLAETKV